MPKKRNPLVTPKQLRSQKPKKNGSTKNGTSKSKRTSLGVSSASIKSPRIKQYKVNEPQVEPKEKKKTLRFAPLEDKKKLRYAPLKDEIKWASLKPSKNKTTKSKASSNTPKASTVLDIDTGELTQVKQPIVNEEANFYSDVIINSWLRALEQFSMGSAYNFLKNWLDDMIAQNGRDNVADMLQEGASNGCILTWEVVYKQGEAERYVSTMLNYLPDQGELYKEDIKDKFEYYRQMTNAMEQDEDWEQPE